MTTPIATPTTLVLATINDGNMRFHISSLRTEQHVEPCTVLQGKRANFLNLPDYWLEVCTFV